MCLMGHTQLEQSTEEGKPKTRLGWETDWITEGLQSQPQMCGTGAKEDCLVQQSHPAATCRLNGKEKRLKRGRPAPQSCSGVCTGESKRHHEDKGSAGG